MARRRGELRTFQMEQHVQGLVTWVEHSSQRDQGRQGFPKDYAGLPGSTKIWGFILRAKEEVIEESQICVYGA